MNKLLLFLIIISVTALYGSSQNKQTYIRVEARKKMVPETPYIAYDTRTVENLSGYLKPGETQKLSKYGGLLNKKQPATGFFHVKKIGDRWWGIDPEGCLYINMAIKQYFPGWFGKESKSIG